MRVCVCVNGGPAFQCEMDWRGSVKLHSNCCSCVNMVVPTAWRGDSLRVQSESTSRIHSPELDSVVAIVQYVKSNFYMRELNKSSNSSPPFFFFFFLAFFSSLDDSGRAGFSGMPIVDEPVSSALGLFFPLLSPFSRRFSLGGGCPAGGDGRRALLEATSSSSPSSSSPSSSLEMATPRSSSCAASRLLLPPTCDATGPPPARPAAILATAAWAGSGPAFSSRLSPSSGSAGLTNGARDASTCASTPMSIRPSWANCLSARSCVKALLLGLVSKMYSRCGARCPGLRRRKKRREREKGRDSLKCLDGYHVVHPLRPRLHPVQFRLPGGSCRSLVVRLPPLGRRCC